MIDTSFWKGKRVLLTGHTGFKGSWLSIWLHELGAEVCGYALEPNTNPSLFQLSNIDQLIKSVIGDIRNLDHLKETMLNFQPEIVIHMAAQPLVRASYENPVDTYAINVMGTVNVLECVRNCQSVRAVLNVTTDKVYENKEWVWGYRESDQLGGYDPYSNSKACSELVTSSYISSFFNPVKYKAHGVAIATARAGNVIGGGDWANERLIPDIIKAIENNKEIIIRNPNANRPWQHVLEPLSGYLMLSEKLFTEGVKWNGSWNFGPDQSNISVGEIAEKILTMYSANNKININISDSHESLMLNLDCSKSKQLLKWKPLFDLNKSLLLTVEWYTKSTQNKLFYENTLEQVKEVKWGNR